MITIEFNARAYFSKVSQLDRAAANLGAGRPVDTNLHETDARSIRELSKAIEQWQRLLRDYQSSLHSEVSKLKKIGDEIEQTDQKLAHYLSARVK
ncbi:TIGR04197 family type VII secretion effector [Sporolactobacillus putidus]|uniref:Uncharacterized protein n=1 Tax=Sporolactobacillus putidus TaxID=492735 RepID=A0A917W022_9BACL|nr:TIGR04197 family type VII secretion effector [Sporolactobacillus putidus]GGL51896.1 hypothetical protein GCM10007968_15050 [Sporolactobacillus putidus]